MITASICATTGLHHADSEGRDEAALEIYARILSAEPDEQDGDVHRVSVRLIRGGYAIGEIADYALRDGSASEMLSDLRWADDDLREALAAVCCDAERIHMIQEIRGAIADAWDEVYYVDNDVMGS